MGSILEERVGLKGAKEPFNFFLLECDPTTAGVSECASTYSGDFWRGGKLPHIFWPTLGFGSSATRHNVVVNCIISILDTLIFLGWGGGGVIPGDRPL